MFRKQIDMLTIGDTTIDAFIRLKEASLHCDINRQDCEICMPFGAKIPYEYTKVVYAAGGASSAAIAGARLGLKTALFSNVGTDQNGRECILKLQKEKVITSMVREHPGKGTNCNFVLWYEDDRTILVNHVQYDHDLKVFNPMVEKAPKWIYLTSLSSHTSHYEKTLVEYLDGRPEVKLAFQPGTFQIERGIDDLKDIIEHTEIIILNLEEAQHLLRVHEKDVKKLLGRLVRAGSKITIITDGTNGSYMFDRDHHYHMPIFPDPQKALERTGCGDAFASTFVSMLILGRTPLEALLAAPVNAMSVVQYVGSHEGLLSLDQLDWFLGRTPEEYRPKEI